MNLREIKDLITLMNENNLGEIEFENEGTKIKLRRNGGTIVQEIQHHPQPAQAAAPAAPAAKPVETGQVIKSPMVGTFYSAPAPDADPYVKVGSKVSLGQVICILEAMKLMNEIKSEIKGVITEVHVNNGDAVEFGQALFTVA